MFITVMFPDYPYDYMTSSNDLSVRSFMLTSMTEQDRTPPLHRLSAEAQADLNSGLADLEHALSCLSAHPDASVGLLTARLASQYVTARRRRLLTQHPSFTPDSDHAEDGSCDSPASAA